MSWNLKLDDITFHELLGEGGYGTVSRITFEEPYIGQIEAAAKNVRHLVKEEIEVLERVNHPHIVGLYGSIQQGPLTLIILEYAHNGTVQDYIEDHHNQPTSNDLLLKWMRESALALGYLHNNKVIHRDIKGSNCLLFEDYTLKLSDFGLARKLEKSMTSSSIKGTLLYMAPEIHKNGHYSNGSDMWAYGMLIINIASGKGPFDDRIVLNAVYQVAENNLTPDIPTSCPAPLADIARRCWSPDPKQRISAESVVSQLKVYEDEMRQHSDESIGISRKDTSTETSTDYLAVLGRQSPTSTMSHDKSFTTADIPQPRSPVLSSTVSHSSKSWITVSSSATASSLDQPRMKPSTAQFMSVDDNMQRGELQSSDAFISREKLEDLCQIMSFAEKLHGQGERLSKSLPIVVKTPSVGSSMYDFGPSDRPLFNDGFTLPIVVKAPSLFGDSSGSLQANSMATTGTQTDPMDMSGFVDHSSIEGFDPFIQPDIQLLFKRFKFKSGHEDIHDHIMSTKSILVYDNEHKDIHDHSTSGNDNKHKYDQRGIEIPPWYDHSIYIPSTNNSKCCCLIL